MHASSTDTPRPDVVIVGAGLAGLSCAVRLQAAGRRCLVLEAADAVGGRVRTDRVDGFLLDRGFQVLLTAYPEARDLLDLDALDLQPFLPGALVRRGGAFHPLGDPFRKPSQALRTLRSPVGSLADKARVGKLRLAATLGSVEGQLTRDDIATEDHLAAAGLSDGMIDGFFRPFLGGVFLDPELATSSRMFRFVFRMFATGQAAIPARGMEEIPRQLAGRLPDGAVRLATAVEAVEPGRVVLAGGQVIACDQVVVATDGASASRLVPGVKAPDWNPVTCVYFAADAAPVAEPILLLDGERAGPINNLVFPTQVSSAYGPGDRTLVCASVIGVDAADPDVEQIVLAQLVDWFGEHAAAWEHLRTYRIAHALPRQLPGWLEPPQRAVRYGEGLYVAGDHLDTASTNGALAAGRRAAAAVLADADAA